MTAAQKPAPKIVGRGCNAQGQPQFFVESRTTEGVTYTVTRLATKLSCNCIAGQHDVVCCHRQAVHAELVSIRQAEQARVQRASARSDAAPLFRSNAAFSIFKS